MVDNQSPALSEFKGVGPANLKKLNKLGLHSAYDLLFHMPLRYEDKTRLVPMQDVQPFDYAQIQGEVIKTYIIQSRRPILVCEISDGTEVVRLKFFNFFYSQRIKMKVGSRIRAYGEIRPGMHGWDMLHPEYVHIGKRAPALAKFLTAVYPKNEGLSQKLVQKLVAQAIQLLAAGTIALDEFLSSEYLQQNNMPAIDEAIALIHQPTAEVKIQEIMQWQHPAQQRMMLEEILVHLLNLKALKAHIQQHAAPQLRMSHQSLQAFTDRLPFTLTAAQQRVIAEIHADMALSMPMQRLLQGDVGSGKTIVAGAAIQAALDNGYQAALMAPTEILAEQHAKNLAQLFADKQVTFLSGSLKTKEREEALQCIESTADLVVGTHALFQAHVNFRNLALVIIDEQHRFGVEQRLALKHKGQDGQQERMPHTLIMTATPIPRTLAQTAYANLDVSIIDELPPNRKSIHTLLLSNEKMQQLADRVEQACAQGEQAYWVCTLIDESEKLKAVAANERMQELQEWFPDINIGLIHGRLKGDEKQAIMQDFVANKIQLLVATTVIEVGVDVPNASLMIIDNAERLGLSQLHQLRGRVGRGNRQSHCVLMYQSPLSETARARLTTMRQTTDGFEIARQDLKLRGPGEILGSRQTGAMAFRLINLERDQRLIALAQSLCEELMVNEPKACEAMLARWNQQQQELAKV